MESEDKELINSVVEEDPDWIKNDPKGEFEGELYLSTDGKQTVHVKSSTDAGRRQALAWAKAVYESIVERYGTKQALNVKAYIQNGNMEQKCGVHGTVMKLIPAGTSKTTGKSYPAFWACQTQNADGSRCSWKPSKESV